MPEPSDDGLTLEETAAVERMLSEAGSAGTKIRGAEIVWGRRHLVRVRTDDGSVIVKRAKLWDDGTVDRASLRAEFAALAMCVQMPRAVAPHLVGFDVGLDLLVMEDLVDGVSLAELLLTGDAVSATDGVRAVARGVAAIHAATAGRDGDYRALTAPLDVGTRAWRMWLDRLVELRGKFAEAVAAEGLSVEGLEAETAAVHDRLANTPRRGLVHGDLCPDNVRIGPDGARLFDFEGSFLGPFALDVGFLTAPFPGCWCFAELPQTVAAQGRSAYEEEMDRLGLDLGEEWALDLASALACFVVVRASSIPSVIEADGEWGTTTMRPRLLAWLERLAGDTVARAAYPALCRTAVGLLEVLVQRWPDVERLGYPAFAADGERAVAVPPSWVPGL